MDFAFTLQMFFVYWKTLSRLWGPGTVYAGQKKEATQTPNTPYPPFNLYKNGWTGV